MWKLLQYRLFFVEEMLIPEKKLYIFTLEKVKILMNNKP